MTGERASAGEVRLVPSGPHAVLVECGSVSPARAAATFRHLDGVRQTVPGATTVLVEHDGRPSVSADLDRALGRLGSQADVATGDDAPLVVIPVHYDGEDLATVAETCGLTVGDVVELHAGSVYESAFCGFAPGFAYLAGLPRSLASVGRRATPRTRVPAGAVAIAGGWSAVYPSASPGGWHLIGHTDAVLWDPTAPSPALLAPGTRVRFTAVRR